MNETLVNVVISFEIDGRANKIPSSFKIDCAPALGARQRKLTRGVVGQTDNLNGPTFGSVAGPIRESF